MEEDFIEMFFQRDVNNYIELTDNPKKPYKLKGKWTNQKDHYLYTRDNNSPVANLNAAITHEALLLYYTQNIPIEDTINNCSDPLKFCFTTLTGRTYDKTYYYYNNEPRLVNKVNRVIATTDTKCGTLKKFKICKDGKHQYDKIAEIPDRCKVVNDDLKLTDDIDKSWYISFAKSKLEELRWV